MDFAALHRLIEKVGKDALRRVGRWLLVGVPSRGKANERSVELCVDERLKRRLLVIEDRNDALVQLVETDQGRAVEVEMDRQSSEHPFNLGLE